MKRLVSIFCCILLLIACLGLPASAKGYQHNKLAIITEPEDIPREDMTYMIGDEQADFSELQWVENGYEGMALKLSGKGEFLRLNYSLVRVAAFTFTAWVNWQGEESGQRLFTIAREKTNFITFSPYMYDMGKTTAEGCLNGLYLGYQYGGDRGKKVDMFTPSRAGDITYALPRNEWHHVAVVSDAKTLKVYMDGVLWLEERVMTSLSELQAHSLDIGNGEWGDPTLEALLDNVIIYRYALKENSIRELAGVAEQPAEPYHPTAPPTTTTTTAPPTTTATPTTAPETLGHTVFGVPMWGVYTIIGVVAAYVAVTIAANVLQHRQKKKEDRS